MKKFYSLTLVAAGLLVASTGADAARHFGQPFGVKRAPKGLAAPGMAVQQTGRHPSAVRKVASQDPAERVIPVSPVSGIAAMAPQRVTSGGTDLYGLLNYSKTSGVYDGWYQFTPAGIQNIWRDPLMSASYGYDELLTSWIKDGNICGFANWYQYGTFWGQKYYEISIATGTVEEYEEKEDWDELFPGVFLSVAYDPEENVVYGYATDAIEEDDDAEKGLFMKTTAYPWGYEVVKEIPKKDFNTQCMSMCYNPVDKKIYGITLNNDLVTIDKATGDQTLVAKLSTRAINAITGMCFSTTENLFYWNPAFGDTASSIVTVNPANGAVNTVLEFPTGGEGFGLLAEIGSTVTGDSPLRPEVKSVDFQAGATTGTVTFTLPTKLTNGNTIEGTLDWTASLDGSRYSEGTGNPGADVVVTYSNLAVKEHTFGLKCSLDGETSAEITTSSYIGFDVPSAPTNVVLEKDNIHWSAVRTGVHGGVIDTENIEYEVFLNGESLGTTKRTSLYKEIGKGQPLQMYQASVIARTGNVTSAAGVSNKLVTGDPWNLPVDVVANAQSFELMKVINVDGEEGNTWEVDPNRDPEAFYSGQADEGRGDDWLILPAINFPDADRYYSLYLTCMRVARVYDDAYIEVCYGEFPDPSSMEGNVIIPNFMPQSRDYATYSNPTFKVPEAGRYYIGLHARTGKDMCGVMVHEIRIEDNNLDPASPAAVNDLAAEAAPNGKLEANVSFKMPSLTISGTALDANAQLTATVSGNTTATVTGKPGEAMTATVGTLQGDNTITVAVSLGDKKGDVARTEVYTGVVVPGLVQNMTAAPSADMMGMSFTWEAPKAYATTGGYVDPATVDYYLITFNGAGDIIAQLIGTGINEYTYRLPEGAPQDYYKVGIEARNAAGTSGRYMAVEAVMGTPYGLPMEDDFEDGDLKFQPWIQYGTGSNVEWFTYDINKIATEWKDMDGVALCGVGNEDAVDESTIGMPRFSTKDQNEVKLIVKAWTGEQSSETSFLCADYGMTDAEVIGTLPYTNSDAMDMWKTIEIQLPSAYMGKDWVQLYIKSNFGPDHNYTIIDEISVVGDHDGVIGVITGEGSIFGSKGCVVVRGFEGEAVEVFSIDGKRVAQAVADSETSIDLPSGIYVVKAGKRTAKISVR